MGSELRERLAEAIANAEAGAGYNWYWNEDTGEHFPKWDELSEEDEECGNDHWVRGRNYYRMRAAVDLAVITEHRASQREAFEQAVDDAIVRAKSQGIVFAETTATNEQRAKVIKQVIDARRAVLAMWEGED